MQDLTPQFKKTAAPENLDMPIPISAPNAQLVGGFQATPGTLRAGKLILDAEHEQIIIGNISSAGVPDILIGNDGTGKYVVRFGSGIDVMAYASTIALDVTKARTHKTTTVNATGASTINASTGGTAGEDMTIIIVNDATSGKTITFGTHFKTTGTIVGTASKTATICFISDGTNWYETSRTLLL